MSLCDVSGGDREDVWVRELIQDVKLASCIVLPDLQGDELSCVRLLSGIVKALVDSAILTPEGEGGREGGRKGGREEGREGGREEGREEGTEGEREKEGGY